MNDSSILSCSSTNSSSGEIRTPDVITTILIINIVLGLPTSSYAIWLSVKQGLQTEIFFFNLALIETIFCLGSVLSVMKFYLRCLKIIKTSLFFGWFLHVGRLLFQCCICMERYVAVVHPLVFLKHRALRFRCAGAALVWILTLSSSIGLAHLHNIHLDYLAYHLLLAQHTVIFLLKLFSCLMVLKVLKQSGPSKGKKDRKVIQKSKVKAFRVIFIVLVASVLTYLPTVSSLVLLNILEWEKFLTAWSVSTYTVIMAGIAQSLLYVYKSVSLPFCKGCK